MIIPIYSAYFLIGVLGDLWLLWFIWAKRIRYRNLYALVISFFSMNLMCLAIIFVPLDSEFLIEMLLRLFYIALFLSAAFFLSFAMQVSTKWKERKFFAQIENGIWIVALCGPLLIIYSDEVVQGYRHITHTVTAVQGSNYWVVILHSFMALITAGAVLIIEWINLPPGRQKQRCLFVLTAYLIHIFCALIVVFMMRLGIDITMATTLPLSSIIFVSLIVYAELNYSELALEFIEPDQESMSDTEKLNDIFNKYTTGVYSFNEATEKLDFLLLMHAYKKHDGNMMKTAKAIGLGRSTLYKKVSKYGLK